MTWRDVGAQVDRVAARLRHDFGFKKGDRLCLLMAGCPEYVISYLAVNLGLTAEGLAAQINKVGAKALVVSPDVWNTKLESVRASLESVQAVFATGEHAAGNACLFCADPRRRRTGAARGGR